MQNEIADYQSAGWALCKIASGDKGAFETGWNTKPFQYVGQRAALLDDWTGGVGLVHAFSGTCAVDIDDIKLALPAFASQGIDLAALLRDPGAVIFGSGRVGRAKLLYALPEPLVGCARHQHGFELRCMYESGASMQDVLPPTIHPDTGKPFHWIKGDWRNLPPLPDVLRRAWPRAKALWPEQAPVKAAAAAQGVSSLTASAMVGMPLTAAEGQRNDFLSKALFGHLKQGGDYEASLEWLREFNQKNCDPPEDDDAKLVKIWRNKAHIEPDPIVIPAPLPGAEPLVFEKKPELPFGYVWDGEWVYHVDASTPPVRTLIYAGPLWVQRLLRTHHLDGTEVRTLEVMSKTGVKTVTTNDLIKATEATLVNLGIYAIDDQSKRVRRYLVACMRDCELKGNIVDTYSTFGWHNDSFLVGHTLYKPHAAPAQVALTPGLMQLAEHMGPAAHGSLMEWREAAHGLLGTNNMAQAFGFLMGIAAPLMKLSGEKGGIYSLVGESGQGKSTAQNAVGTLFGDPEAFRTVPRDTQTARMIKLSLLSNLPMIAEEMTKMETGDLSTLAYAVSEGRDKDRADQHGDLKARAASWSTLLVSSSNTSLMDALLIADGAPAAYRLLEDTVALPKGSKQADGDRIMRGLVANQGHAGHVFAQYIVDNREQLASMIHRTAAQLSLKARGSTKERIRINMLACAIVAGAALNACGVLRFNLPDFAEYGLQVLRRNMGSQQEAEVSMADVLQAFIDKNQAGVLRMKGDSPLNVVSIQGRTSPLIMRYDIASEELMVNKTALREYVQERKQSWTEFKKWMTAEGFLKREGKNMLSRGSGLPASPQVHVIVLDNAILNALDAQKDSRTALTTAATV